MENMENYYGELADSGGLEAYQPAGPPVYASGGGGPRPRASTWRGRRPWLAAAWLLAVLLVLLWEQPGLVAADLLGAGEDLHYRAQLGLLEDAGRVRLILKPLGAERYLAEVSITVQGAAGLVRNLLPERYQTEMLYRQGRLQPLVFREEFQSKGKHTRKEFRFDYQEGRLEMWLGEENRPMVKKWQVPMREPVYDPLTLLYNVRLGAMGPLSSNQPLRVAGIPTPEPRDMILQTRGEDSLGRKIMVTAKAPAANKESGPYFFQISPEGTPRLAWTRVMPFGKLTVRLVQEALKNPDQSPASLSVAPDRK